MKRSILKKTSVMLTVLFLGVGISGNTVFAAEPEQGPEHAACTEEAVQEKMTGTEEAAEDVEMMGAEETVFEEITGGGELDLEGITGADVAGIVTEEGVCVETGVAVRSFGFSGAADITPLRFTIDRSFGEYGSMRGSFIMVPALEYNLQMSLSGIEELELGLRGRVEANDISVSCKTGGVIPIATIPYTFGDGMFTAYVTLQVAYTAEGEAFLTYEMDGYCGVKYDGENTTFVCDYQPEELNYGIGGSGKIETNLGMRLVAYDTYTLMDVNMNAGLTAEGRIYDSEEKEDFAELYFYMNGNYGYDSVLAQYGVCGSKVIFDKENSPLSWGVVF